MTVEVPTTTRGKSLKKELTRPGDSYARLEIALIACGASSN
jgi:hypothetical protein